MIEQRGTPEASTPDAAAILEKVIVGGDLSKLSTAERMAYYSRVCESLSLNPLTQPFAYVTLRGRGLTLYALKAATDQLRKIHGVSITRLDVAYQDDLVVVTVQAVDRSGRTDTDVGVVAVGKLSGEERANAVLKSVCVPVDSEILTRDGFKTYDALVEGEEVLAYDVAADRTVWTPLRAVTVHESLPMARLRSIKGLFDVRCTPDHTWAVRRSAPYRPDTRGDGTRGARGPYLSRGAERALVQAQRLLSHHAVILAAAEAGVSEEESLLRPVEAAVLAWAVTDGTIQRRGAHARMGICQSKEVNFAAIRELVAAVAPGVPELVSAPRTRTFPGSGATYDTLSQHWWYIPAAVTRAILNRAGYHDRSDLPRIVTRLSSPARQAMLQAFMLAEGDATGIFCNTDRHVLDAFAILSALEGHATGQEHQRASAVYQRLKKTRHVRGRNVRLEPAEPQPAWCPTTDYGTWVMRQNGRVMITGNTKAKRRVTLSICGLGMLDETEVETIPGAEVVVEQAGSASATALPPALSEKRATAPGTVAEQAARAELVAVARQVQTDDALLNADEATAEAGTEHTSPTFTEQAAAALREPDASTEPLSDDGCMSGLRAEVAALLERDGAALDLLKAKGTLLPDMTAEQLSKAKDWLLERERRNVPVSERLSRTIKGAKTPEDLRGVQQAVQKAKDGRGISQTEYVGLLREVEGRRQALAAGPLTAGLQRNAAGVQP